MILDLPLGRFVQVRRTVIARKHEDARDRLRLAEATVKQTAAVIVSTTPGIKKKAMQAVIDAVDLTGDVKEILKAGKASRVRSIPSVKQFLSGIGGGDDFLTEEEQEELRPKE